MKTTTETITKSYATIKLGIDAHSKWYYVARQLDVAMGGPNLVVEPGLGWEGWRRPDQVLRLIGALYTLVENGKRQGVRVEATLKHLLEVLPLTHDPKTIAALTPARIAAARSRNRSAA